MQKKFIYLCGGQSVHPQKVSKYLTDLAREPRIVIPQKKIDFKNCKEKRSQSQIGCKNNPNNSTLRLQWTENNLKD